MKILFVVVIVSALAALAVWWLGARLPIDHRAAADVWLHQSPEAVYEVVADVAHAAAWRKDVTSIEMLPPAADGTPRFREVGKNGAMTYRIEAASRPSRFVTRIDDATLPFGGSWTITISADNGGSRVHIVEEGEVKPPFFRFMARYVFGYYATMKTYLSSLAAHFGETSPPREVRGD